MSGDSAGGGGKAGPSGSVWQTPAMVAAIMTALITGVFGVFQVLIPLMDEPLEGEKAPVSDQAEPVPPEIATDPRAVIVQASRMLSDPGTPIEHRIEVIRAITQASGAGAPPGYHADAIDVLVSYLERAVDERRHVKDEHGKPYQREEPPHSGRLVEPDPRMTRPLSIVAALEALDVVRDAAPQPLPVNIGNIDFSYMILSGLDLSGFNAGHGRFASTFLSGCDCRGTNFNNADLRGAVIWTEQQSRFDGASFINSRIEGSKWANVNMTGALLDRAIGIPDVWCDIEPAAMQARFSLPCPER